MRVALVVASLAVLVASSAARAASLTVPGLGEVGLVCEKPGSWTFGLASVRTNGIDEVRVTCQSPVEAVPPVFKVEFAVDGARARNTWTPYSERLMLRPDGWGDYPYWSSLAYQSPIAAAIGDDTNVLAIATAEALRKVEYALLTNENTCRLTARFRYFTEPEAPMKSYETLIRIDRRPVFWGDAVAEASDWITRRANLTPCPVPSAAYDPLYSSWYAFEQDVHAPILEREMRLAAPLGMKTAILDDGWQKVASRTFYSGTGDWEPVPSRFPSMRAHVDAVHAAGLKYMLWIALPLVGDESRTWQRFRDKFLFIHKGGTAVLDPRFPEVREHLSEICLRAVRDWDFDGLKLDFIDQFAFEADDPDVPNHATFEDRAVRENYAGRDIRSLPLATDRLMSEIVRRLRAVKPDVLVEFRQHYSGPAIRQYGNMIRGIDCPDDLNKNRKEICDLRATSGTTSVHADMLVWSPRETPEGAAQSVLSALFGVVQYSMRLDGLPSAHRQMMRNWIDFSVRHREALLKGTFRGHHPELGYPIVEGESADERIVAVYMDGASATLARGKRNVVINASGRTGVLAYLPEPCFAVCYDTLGNRVSAESFPAGAALLPIPPSGRAELASPRPKKVAPAPSAAAR